MRYEILDRLSIIDFLSKFFHKNLMLFGYIFIIFVILSLRIFLKQVHFFSVSFWLITLEIHGNLYMALLKIWLTPSTSQAY